MLLSWLFGGLFFPRHTVSLSICGFKYFFNGSFYELEFYFSDDFLPKRCFYRLMGSNTDVQKSCTYMMHVIW